MVFILVGIDPLDQPCVNSIYKFNSKKKKQHISLVSGCKNNLKSCLLNHKE